MTYSRLRHHQKADPRGRDGGTRFSIAVTLFLLSVISPFLFQVGPLLLTSNRLLLVVMTIPCLVIWLRGGAGPFRIADFALLFMWFWGTISFFVFHGVGATLEARGISFVETMGAYLLARCFVRDAETFRGMVATLFAIIMILLPFALFETLTGQNVLLRTANAIWNSLGDVPKEQRWGLDRVQSVFQHPIHFCVFTGSAVALAHYVLGEKSSFLGRWLRTGLVSFTAMLSLSAGPFTAVVAQVLLILWDRCLSSIKKRWQILAGGLLSLVVAIEIAAQRTTPELFIHYFAFSRHTASNRIRIWEYGSASVLEHPLLGIGRNEWERAYWMSSSMDMYWLVVAVRYGLPAGLALQLAVFAVFFALIFKSTLDQRTSNYRTGFLICLVGFYISGWTVDYWKAIYTLFMFLLGSGVWMLDVKGESDVPSTDTNRTRRRSLRLRPARSRFPGARAISRKSVHPGG